jgi:hypothetical protein
MEGPPIRFQRRRYRGASPGWRFRGQEHHNVGRDGHVHIDVKTMSSLISHIQPETRYG